MSEKMERYTITLSEDQGKWLRLYIAEHSLNNVQGAIRHLVDCASDDGMSADGKKETYSQKQAKVLRKYATELKTISDALAHLGESDSDGTKGRKSS